MNAPADAKWDSLSDRIATKFVTPQLKTIDGWRVIRDLGSGSTAHVWLMQHEKRAHFVACKTPKLSRTRLRFRKKRSWPVH